MKNRTYKKRTHEKRTHKKRTHKKRIYKRKTKRGGGKGTKSKGKSKGKTKASNSSASQLTSLEEILRRGKKRSPETTAINDPNIRREIFKFLMENKPDSYSPVYEQDGDIQKRVTLASDLRRPINESISETIKGANLKPRDMKNFNKHDIETTQQLIGIVFMFMGEDITKEEVIESLDKWLLKKIIIDNKDKRKYIIDYLIDRIEMMGVKIPE